jgi:ABC-type multidrug transport system fused ATPase/permease subunit
LAPGVLVAPLLAPALDLLTRGLLALLLVTALLFVEPWVVLGACALVAVYYWLVMRPIRASAARASDKIKRDVRALHFEIQQWLGGIKPILAGGRSAYFAGRIEQVSQRLTDEIAALPLHPALLRSSLETLVFGGMIAWVVGALLAGAELTTLLPRVGLLAAVAYRLMPSMQTIFANIASMTANRHALEEVTELMREQSQYADTLPASPADASVQPLPWTREVRFENVSFRYRGAAEPAIEDVSLSIAKGQRTALVGATGAGKSTVIDLLLGLHRPTEGQILVDGAPLGPEHMAAWRRTVGYVPQELFLLDGTIAQNIAFGSDLDAQRVGDAARLAQADEFIDRSRGGLETAVGERGVRLSGGQRQRLALARALYARPNLIVLDEATSALDPQTEHKVVAALPLAAEALTIVTVSHRLASVRDYDCIHFLERGRVVASGTFDDLLAREEAFRRFAGHITKLDKKNFPTSA